GAPEASVQPPVVVRRVLPDVRRDASSAAWLASRARTYWLRDSVRRRALREQHFDLVHYHYPNRFTDTTRAPTRPWVLSVHDVRPHSPRLGRLEVPLLRLLYSRPDALVVHHPLLAEQLQDEFGVAQDRIFVVPHQVFPVIDPVPLPKQPQATVLFFGALRDNKGLDVFAEAVATADRDRFRFQIAGRGSDRMERLAMSLAETYDNVDAEIGYVSTARKAELFHEATIVAMPYTTFNSQSGVLHDAYGHGRPVVVTDVGALGQTVREDGTGIVVPPGDATAVLAALETIASAPEVFAAAARQIALDRDPEHTGLRLRAVYDHLL
ncbi:MAG TPA: glycosyltransferase family 4 protein, partial [Ilumatobacter sp.]|nr:glycosyltransferase family 4 protein [Ilumatobacter sp.]